MAVIKLAEAGELVDLVSLVPVKRSHSVCAQGGINAAVNIKGENDSPEIHFVDTVRGGDFLAHQPPAKAMCYDAPAIVWMLDRMGVPFTRTAEGHLDFRRFGGTLYNRTAFAGATTGQQMLYALDEQVRRHEAEGRVRKLEGWEFLDLVLDENGSCRGVVCLDLQTMRVHALRAEAVLMATGGPGLLFGKSTNSALNTGSAAAACYRRGAAYANGEFIQIHPTAVPGVDKLRLMSESARGEGGRIWVPRQKGDPREPSDIPESERWYFLEEKYPRYGNLVPRDVASREIYHVCHDLGMGLDGGNEVYLDLTHIPRAELDRKLGGILEIYEKFAGGDPHEVPMRIFPSVHYSMGGLWVDYERTAEGFLVDASPRNQTTSIPGLYAAGEVDYQYHGANRLGANSLLSCIFGGRIVAPAMRSWAGQLATATRDLPAGLFEAAAQDWQRRLEETAAMAGPENPYRLAAALGETMRENVTIERRNDALEETNTKILELKDRWPRCAALDTSRWANRSVPFLLELRNMLDLALVVVRGALARDESRGSHFKPDFPKRDDEAWLRTTKATWTEDGPELSYEPVDISLVEPVERKYD